MNEPKTYEVIQQYFIGKPVKKVQLFGSYARSEADENSDVDLLITMEHSVGLFKLASYKLELETLLNKTVDLATESSLSKRFYTIIKDDLTTVYERA